MKRRYFVLTDAQQLRYYEQGASPPPSAPDAAGSDAASAPSIASPLVPLTPHAPGLGAPLGVIDMKTA